MQLSFLNMFTGVLFDSNLDRTTDYWSLKVLPRAMAPLSNFTNIFHIILITLCKLSKLFFIKHYLIACNFCDKRLEIREKSGVTNSMNTL